MARCQPTRPKRYRTLLVSDHEGLQVAGDLRVLPVSASCRTALPRLHSTVRRCQSVQQVRRVRREPGTSTRCQLSTPSHNLGLAHGGRVGQALRPVVWHSGVEWGAHASGRHTRSCLPMIIYVSWIISAGSYPGKRCSHFTPRTPPTPTGVVVTGQNPGELHQQGAPGVWLGAPCVW
jgi:hypothetical protein